MKPVAFSDEAGAELTDAAVRYEGEQEGLGVRFRDAVYAACERIATHPAIGERVPRTPCRQCVVTDFPYSVIYTEQAETIEINAVAHHKRRRGYWKRRLQDR